MNGYCREQRVVFTPIFLKKCCCLNSFFLYNTEIEITLPKLLWMERKLCLVYYWSHNLCLAIHVSFLLASKLPSGVLSKSEALLQGLLIALCDLLLHRALSPFLILTQSVSLSQSLLCWAPGGLYIVLCYRGQFLCFMSWMLWFVQTLN